MPRIHGRLAILCAGLTLLVVGAYANHFQNDFHFDDIHTITEETLWRDVAVKSPHNAAAKQAIALKPDYAEAYNNIAAANIALHRWDEAMRAARKAIRIRPDFEPAKKNLQRAETGSGR